MRMILRAGVAAFSLTTVFAAGAGDLEYGDRPGGDRPVVDVPPIDGTNHNLTDPSMNAAGTRAKRYLPATYADGLGQLGSPAPLISDGRVISNKVFAQTPEAKLNTHNTNNLLWHFGQFLDHDFGNTVDHSPAEPIHITVPEDDPFFDPQLRPAIIIHRQHYDAETGVPPAPNPRLSVNEQTGWIDASQVYGYGQTLPAVGANPSGPTPGVLREGAGGRLLVEAETNLLPRIETTLPTPQFPPKLFVCGDSFPRCNEQPGLAMMHTLFVREHNRKAAELAASNPEWTDEQIFQKARQWVTSVMQAITVNEFIPTLTGRRLPKYAGHRPRTNGRLALEFEHALFRLGHSMVSSVLEQGDGKPALDLGQSLFQSSAILQTSADLDALIRGSVHQRHEKLDCQVVDGLRNTLIVDEPGDKGTLFDLPAINVARGLDLGLPSYNQARAGFGLSAVTDFRRAFDADAAARLAAAYPTVDDIDLFAGGICERSRGRGQTGPLTTAVLLRQIYELRAADRFWFENVLTPREIEQVAAYTLARLIINNSGLSRQELRSNAFKVR